MSRALYDVWESEDPLGLLTPQSFHWCAQLSGVVGYFRTREDAEQYVASVKEKREKQEKSK